ncbi:hypothetical protein [Streptomyces armeniacus]|uniref:hypothetical protein n=1 Tax=Streptomyces armeniacus TaxID=83291 RepID=UPI001FEB0479|nr:hypothetical protein [Streptomyces armeniacus]
MRVEQTGSGTDTEVRTVVSGSPGEDDADQAVPGVPLLLAEIHPDTFTPPACGTPAPLSQPPETAQDAWPGFFHRAHRLLPPEGLLLVATRQRRDDGELTDPLGEVIASARTAGFTYLQHIAVIHAHAVGNRLVPDSGTDLPPGLAHSDLLILSPHPYV